MTEDTTAEAQPVQPPRTSRSPSYPGIDLALAVERAAQLWKNEHHYPTAVETILGHWGYSAKSGGGFAALAALKSFGLVQDEGSGKNRTAVLTRSAQDIITSENPDERAKLIKAAALTPKVHAELWDKYGAKLPSDQSIELFLSRERGFTPGGATELVSEWKRTMAFAKLADGTGTVPGHDNPPSDVKPDPSGATMTPPPVITPEREDPLVQPQTPPAPERQDEQPPQSLTMQVPYARGKYALLQAEFPMTEAHWKQMLTVLEAMKPALVDDGSS